MRPCTNLQRMVHVVWQPVTRWMALEWCYSTCVSVCESPVFFPASVHLSFYCVPGVTFSPDQLKGGRVWNQDRPYNPIQRKGSVFTPLEGAGCGTFYTHPLSVWPCCVLCVNMHLCVCVVKLEYFFFVCFAPDPPKLCNLEALILQHSHCLHVLFSEHLSCHWLSIVCHTDVLFVYRGS